jgi:hypothetical protein
MYKTTENRSGRSSSSGSNVSVPQDCIAEVTALDKAVTTTDPTTTRQESRNNNNKEVRFHDRVRFRRACSPKTEDEAKSIWYSSDEIAESMEREEKIGHNKKCRDSRTLSLLGLPFKQEQETVYQRGLDSKRTVYDQQARQKEGCDLNTDMIAQAYGVCSIKAANCAYQRGIRSAKHVEKVWYDTIGDESRNNKNKEVRFHDRVRFRRACSPKTEDEAKSIWYSSDEIAESMEREEKLRIHLAIGNDKKCRDSVTLSLLGLPSKQKQKIVYQRKLDSKRTVYDQQARKEEGYALNTDMIAQAYGVCSIKAAKSAYRRGIRSAKHVEEVWDDTVEKTVEDPLRSTSFHAQGDENDHVPSEPMESHELGSYLLYTCPKSSWSSLANDSTIGSESMKSDHEEPFEVPSTPGSSSSWIAGLIGIIPPKRH